ncbi:YihY/virulence factor BrkB family protein [Metabacillus sediminilitoris]|uniref:YihY/virulence factor BrkB family protein n=1 Tax=Metabacillus sediminilitoris TaxID=2567941 RepID=A0A4S4C0R1_9BACI|nr:YihY/virulence factor BrkB family protein [Metabacillus sediminilitoris]QGQ48877.1 YihY family inner membrane protein [Metabacillus sediminilitoris]THF81141.1 YihY/virulence factor BrkB family protein [Metabacillus sediminilitoris]
MIKEFKEDRVTGLAAQQAYYYFLSLIPMLILLVSIVPYLNIDPNKALAFMDNVLAPETAQLIKDNILTIISNESGGLLTFGIIGTIWSASSGMDAFIRAMNIAYDVEETRSFIKIRLISIFLTLGLILSIVVALVFPIFGQVIFDFVQSFIPVSEQFEVIITILRWGIAGIVIIGFLMTLYLVAPNKRFPWKHVIPGAVFAALLWLVGSIAFSFYVSNFGNYTATYGSLGGVIVLMLWLFLTGLTFVLGGEINAVYHREKSQKLITQKAVSS